MARIEDKLAFESSELIFENITLADLKIAAEIFIFLRTCPGTDDGLKTWFTSWSSFYEDLFSTHTLDKIILTLNRIMKNDNTDSKVRSQKLLKRVAKYSSLKYEEIQSMLAGHTSKNKSDIESLQESNLEGVYLMCFNYFFKGLFPYYIIIFWGVLPPLVVK